MQRQSYPDGYLLQLYIRPSVSLVINVDRYEGARSDGESGGWQIAMLSFERLYKHYRRGIELPGARIIQMRVRAGDMEEPAIRAYQVCVRDLGGVEEFLRTEVLPRAFSWDAENGFLPDVDAIVRLLASELAEEIEAGNRDGSMEFLTLGEVHERLARGR